VIVPSQHDSVSLRHVAVLVRQTTEGAVETQVLDLATDHGFEDEEGNLQHSVTSNGSMFLRVGTVNLLLLTTPAPFSGEETAEEAYTKIPPRVIVDAVDKGDSPPPARQRHEPQTFDVRDAPTMVRTRPGPRLDFDALCDADESPVAVLSMGASDAPRVCTVGAEALDRGFLFGRYARCHLQAVEDLSTLGISRVHLLIIRSAGHMIAVDTASSNGVCVNRESTRVRALESGDELELSEDFRLTWHTTN